MQRELPTRKNIRLDGYDYSQAGYYFVTICVKDRHEMLGSVVGDGVLDVPSTQLSEYGVIAENHINAISDHYKHIDIQKFIIMPTHIHMLIFVKDCGTSGTPSPTNAVIPSLVSTLKRFVHKDCGFVLFQRSYHDHIIRNEDEYQQIWLYIDENPAKWPEDCYYRVN